VAMTGDPEKSRRNLSLAMSQSIEKGIEFLLSSQHSDGYMPSFMADDRDLRINRSEDRSVFISQHVMASLLRVENDKAKQIVQQILKFLLSDCWYGGLWKFWTKDHAGRYAIPLDTDDTACVAHLIEQMHLPVSSLTRRILLGNRDKNGLFRTWILPRFSHLFQPRHWLILARMRAHPLQLHAFFSAGGANAGDVDAVVNANAVLLFGENADTREAINWIHAIVLNGEEASFDRFYQSRLALYYALLRCWKNGCKAFDSLHELIVQRIQECLNDTDGSNQNALEVALSVIILCAWAPDAEELEDSIQFLLQSQQDDGHWPARVLFYGNSECTICWGSEQLTTGFCVEALTEYQSVANRMHPANC